MSAEADRAAHPGAFAVLLKRSRAGAGLTQEELAERAELSPKAVSSLERGARRRPHRVTVALLADALGLDDSDRERFELAARSGGEGIAAVGQKSVELPAGAYLGAIPGESLVARAAEMRLFEEVLSEVADGAGRTVLLRGEPGIGKTRLAQEAHALASSRQFSAAVGRCYQPQSAVPYFPFLQVIDMLLRELPHPTRLETLHRWPALAPLVPEQALNEASKETDQIVVFRAVGGLVGELARVSPLVVLLDDLHWADASSVQLFQHLARETRGERVFLLATFRDTDVSAAPDLQRVIHTLDREALVTQVEVPRLGLGETRELLQALLEPSVDADGLSELIFRRAEGNPYFVRQIAITLEDSIGASAKVEAALPESIKTLILQRTENLTVSGAEVLGHVAVLGPAFSFEDALVLTQGDEDVLESALVSAERWGLIRETQSERYAFDHGLTQQALYDSIPSRRRRRLHGLVGKYISELADRERRGRLAELVWHLARAEEKEGALVWALEAGAAAISISALSEAEQQFRTAVRLAEQLEDKSRRARALEGLGHVCNALGRYQEAREALEAAATTFTQDRDDLAVAEIAGELGAVYRVLGLTEQAIHVMEDSLRRLENAPKAALPMRAELLAALAQILWPVGRRAEALTAVEQAAAIAAACGETRTEAWAETQQARMLERMGRRAEALAAAEAALPRLESSHDQGHLWYCLSVLTQMYEDRGQWERARELIQRSIQIAEQRGDPQYLAASLGRLAGYLTWRGDYVGAHETVSRALRCIDDSDPISSFLRLVEAKLRSWEGDMDELETDLEKLILDSGAAGNIDRQLEATLLLTTLFSRDGRYTESLARLQSLSFGETDIEAGACLVDALLGLGKFDEAAAICSQLLAQARTDGLGTALIDLLRLSAEIAVATSAKNAAALGAEALELARRMGSPYKEATCEKTMAAIKAAQGAGAPSATS